MIFFFSFFYLCHHFVFFPDKEQMCLWQCSPPTPGSTHPSTLMLSTSAGFFLRSFAVEFTHIVFLSRFLTWAFHIFFYDIAYEPEGWPWKPVSIFVSFSLVQNSFRKFDTPWFHISSIFGVDFNCYYKVGFVVYASLLRRIKIDEKGNRGMY